MTLARSATLSQAPQANFMYRTPTLAWLLTVILCSSVQAAPPVLRLCYEVDEGMPFVADAHQQPPGLLLELVMAAAEQAEIKLEFQRLPWKLCIYQLQNGQSDGVFPAIWQADRDAWGQFPGRDVTLGRQADHNYRLWQGNYHVITRSNSPLKWDGQRFSGLQHGLTAPLGYVATQRLHALGGLSTSAPHAPERALKLVALGRLDGYILEHLIGTAYLRRLALQDDLIFLPQPFLQADWHLPLSHTFFRQHPDLAQHFWNALRTQREQRDIELTKRYLGPL